MIDIYLHSNIRVSIHMNLIDKKRNKNKQKNNKNKNYLFKTKNHI